MDLIERQAAIDVVKGIDSGFVKYIEELPSAQPENCEYCRNLNKTMLLIPQPERLTDDDFETIRIHLSDYKERLCNQRRWKEAEEYQRIIDRFMSFASAQPEPQWIPCSERLPEERDNILVTNGQSVMEAYFIQGEFLGTMIIRNNPFKVSDVTAWMPLPEPWRGEEDG